MFIVDDVTLVLLAAAISKIVMEVGAEVAAELIIEGAKNIGSQEAIQDFGSAISDACISPMEGALYQFTANASFDGDCMTMLEIILK